MKTIKILVIILVVFIVGLLIWAAFLPSEIHIKQSVSIKAPAAVVFDEVNDLRNWNDWSPYKDSALKSRFEGPIRGVGARVIWTDSREGTAILTITESVQYDLIKAEMEIPGQENNAAIRFTFNQKNDSTTEVVWETDLKGFDYPFGRFAGWMLEKGYNYNFKRGLDSLKQYVETYLAEPEYYGYQIELKEYPGAKVLALDDSCLMSEMSLHISDDFNVIRSYAARKGLKELDYPMIQWHTYKPESYTTFTCMIPYDADSVPNIGKIYWKQFPANKVAVIEYTGSYDFSYYAWIALDNYRKFHSMHIADDPWEEYVKGPRNETDSSKFVTNIYFPYK